MTDTTVEAAAGQTSFADRFRSFAEGREGLIAAGGGALAGFAFLLATSAASMATSCMAPAVMAQLQVGTLI